MTYSGTLNHLLYLVEMYVVLIFRVFFFFLILVLRSNSALLSDVPQSVGSFLPLVPTPSRSRHRMSMTNNGNCSSALGDSYANSEAPSCGPLSAIRWQHFRIILRLPWILLSSVQVNVQQIRWWVCIFCNRDPPTLIYIKKASVCNPVLWNSEIKILICFFKRCDRDIEDKRHKIMIGG